MNIIILKIVLISTVLLENFNCEYLKKLSKNNHSYTEDLKINDYNLNNLFNGQHHISEEIIQSKVYTLF